LKLKVAAIGLGWVTEHRHLPWLSRTAGAELVGVVDPDPVKARRFARGYGVEHSSGSLPHEVPWLEQVDAVTIGTPPTTHRPLVDAYLRAGKHVLVEKPLAMTVAEANGLLEIAAGAGRVLAVVHNFQFSRSVLKLLYLLATGRLGEVQGVWATQLSNPRRRLPAWYDELPLGLFYDESPHLLYLVRAVLGAEPELKTAFVAPSRHGKRTPAHVSAEFDAGGVPVHLALSFEAPVSEWHLAVLGSRRLAVVDVFRDILVTTANDGRHGPLDILRTSFEAGLGHYRGVLSSGALHALGRLSYGNDEVMRRFVSACLDGREPDGISGADGRQVVALQHAVMEAAAVGSR
jgi:scyllo-inositol 2-dehydrogenase (NADP+)